MYVIPKVLLPHELAELEKQKQEREEWKLLQKAREDLRKTRDLELDTFEQVPIVPSMMNLFSDQYQLLQVWRNTQVRELTPPPVWVAWHGTSVANVESVSSRGLTTKKSTSHSLFGAGIYLTRDLTKALGYSSSRKSGPIQAILRCRVAMGEILVGSVWNRDVKVGFGPRFSHNSVFCGAGSEIAHAWGRMVANEELVVYDDRQVQVQEIFLLHPASSKLIEAPPAKQRVGQRQISQQRRMQKYRASMKDHIVRHHLCVKNGEPCRFADVTKRQSEWLIKCTRFNLYVTRYPVGLTQRKSLIQANCSHFFSS